MAALSPRGRPIARLAVVLLVALGGAACWAAAAASSGGPVNAGVTLTEGGGVWSPDGGSIARVVEGGIEVAKPDGERLRMFRVPTPARGIAWADNGRTLLFVTKEAHQKPDRTERIGRVRLGGTPSFTPVGTHIGSLGWSPGGWPLVFATTYLYYDLQRGPIGPKPALWTIDGPGRRARQILDLPGEERYPHVSPDGAAIIFGIETNRGGNGLWLLRRGGSGARRLVPGFRGGAASWSPDGSTIAFTAALGDDRRRRLYLVSASGGAAHKLSSEEVLGDPPAWTPDGEWITYSNYDGEVRRVHPDGTGAETIAVLPDEEVRNLSWSPDGAHLAYTAQPISESD